MYHNLLSDTPPIQIGASLRESHKDSGFVGERVKRKNHDEEKLGEMLVVPQYDDLPLGDEAEDSGDEETTGSPTKSALVKSRAQWRKEMAKWVQSEQETDEGEDEHTSTPATTQRPKKWLPRSLDLLFGGRPETTSEQQALNLHRQKAYTEEARLMELLVDEEEGETILDDGELEGSGDDFDG